MSTSQPRREDFAHALRVPVRWGDMDTLGHVNNARFFTYDESSRLAYFQRWAERDPRMWKEHGLILASIGADFLAQLRYPADLDVGVRIARMGRSSFSTIGGQFEGERCVAVVKANLVWFDYAKQKSMPIPAEVREWIIASEIVAPEQG